MTIPLKSITHSTSYATALFIEFSEIIKIVYNSTVKSGREGGGGDEKRSTTELVVCIYE